MAIINPLTPGTFCQNCGFFFYIFVVLWPDLGQISLSLVENAFATRQLAVLATRITFWLRHCAEIKIWKPTALGFSNFEFFLLSFFSFLFAAVIGLLPGSLADKKMSKKESLRQPIFTKEQQCVVAGNLALSFSLIFFSIFVHISGSNEPITVN